MSAAPYALPELPYAYEALEPHVSALVMELHHSKHHAAYVKGANEAVASLMEARNQEDWSALTQLEKNLAFNLSGHVLHSVLWTSMGPGGQREPDGALAVQIADNFGDLERLQGQMNAACRTLQGSGWAALTWEPTAARLMVQQVYDHQGNIGFGTSPLMVIDGWEHAYYLDHHQDKAAWTEAFWQVADWTAACKRFCELAG